MENINVQPQVEETKPDLRQQPQKVLPSKLVVAVHGIGDQFQFATIQSVASRFCHSYGNPQALPLGSFYDEAIGRPPDTYLLQRILDQNSKEEVGFTEIYWADIPRIPEKEGYTIEESKKWGKTVVDRLRPHSKPDSKDLTPNDLEMAKGLLDEMIDTINVLERLVFLAEKAGVFKFNLKDVLISYLGDVQLVADFKKYRDKILHRFFEVMNHVARVNPKADIYIVAHSEGTVIAFLSLLEAVGGNVPTDVEEKVDVHERRLDCEWLKQVKGFMTIGSPIDKHLIFWPDIWKNYQTRPKVNIPPHKINWRNYYDYGDPIGFELNTTNAWLCQYGFENVFDFPLSHNYGFGRYFFPGKAHNDYWTDKAVFDHFINTAVKAEPVTANKITSMCDKSIEAASKDEPSPPADCYPKKLGSNVLPYVLVFGLIFLGVYFLYKAVHNYTGPDDSSAHLLRTVAGITCLLAGLTVAAQVPRLTRVWKWRFAAFALFAIFAGLYRVITPPDVHLGLGGFIAKPFVSSVTWQNAGGGVIALASLIAIGVYLVGRKWPRGGLKILLGFGIFGLVLTVGVNLYLAHDANKPAGDSVRPSAQAVSQPEQNQVTAAAQANAPEKSEPRIWPVFIAAAAFLYLWWLAALLFDLVVVWHYYIRRSVAMDRLRYLHERRQN